MRILLIGSGRPGLAPVRIALQEAFGSGLDLDCMPADEAGVTALTEGRRDVCLLECAGDWTRGFSILRRAAQAGCRTPVIALTDTAANETVAADLLEAGAADCLPRSALTPGVLRRVITRTVEYARTIEALKENQSALQLTQSSVDRAASLVFWVDPQGRFLYANDAACRRLGYSRAEIQTLSAPDVLAGITDDDLGARWCEARTLGAVTGETSLRTRDGTSFQAEYTANSLEFEGRERLVVFAQDVTARKRAELALRQSEEGYRSLIKNAVYGIYRSTVDGRFVVVNPALVAMLGYASEAELMTVEVESLYVDPSERRRFIDRLQSNRIEGLEAEWKRKDGSRITVRLSGRVLRSGEGELDGFEMIVEDVTAHRLLESQFRQAQKMEAIGRLAGGIAHDFNNLLTAMLGYSDLLLDQFAEGSPCRSDVLEIKKAAERASSLTRQLLAFSRKQVLQPKPLDLNAIVSGFDKMLRRLIGEDVELTTVLGEDLGLVKADPGQIEQVIMNLAVNARDAMPNGGKLIIETANADLDATYARLHEPANPGRYVMLAVSDTGCGMDDEVKSHLFEPFFSTKERGKGTGLGLATVYGIVKQSGGYIWAYGEPDHGASFKIYLPQIDAAEFETAGMAGTSGSSNGSETVLVVEDELAVRRLAAEVLRRHGYQVLEAGDGGEAIAVADGHPGKIHVLLTDLIMPEMNGADLATRLTERRPATRVLYISGYTDQAVMRGGVLEPGTNFLQKPFTSDSLVSALRQVLDRE